MDWRAFSGRTVSGIPASRILKPGFANLQVATTELAKGLAENVNVQDMSRGVVRIVEWDSMRGWSVALAWMLTSFVE